MLHALAEADGVAGASVMRALIRKAYAAMRPPIAGAPAPLAEQPRAAGVAP